MNSKFYPRLFEFERGDSSMKNNLGLGKVQKNLEWAQHILKNHWEFKDGRFDPQVNKATLFIHDIENFNGIKDIEELNTQFIKTNVFNLISSLDFYGSIGDAIKTYIEDNEVSLKKTYVAVTFKNDLEFLYTALYNKEYTKNKSIIKPIFKKDFDANPFYFINNWLYRPLLEEFFTSTEIKNAINKSIKDKPYRRSDIDDSNIIIFLNTYVPEFLKDWMNKFPTVIFDDNWYWNVFHTNILSKTFLSDLLSKAISATDMKKSWITQANFKFIYGLNPKFALEWQKKFNNPDIIRLMRKDFPEELEAMNKSTGISIIMDRSDEENQKDFKKALKLSEKNWVVISTPRQMKNRTLALVHKNFHQDYLDYIDQFNQNPSNGYYYLIYPSGRISINGSSSPIFYDNTKTYVELLKILNDTVKDI